MTISNCHRSCISLDNALYNNTDPPLIMNKKLPLIFTDLDGSLLDHHTYSFQPAVPLMERLRCKNIPVIANTSKTKEELLHIRTSMDNRDPFITENGAAVYLPPHLAYKKTNGLQKKGEYYCRPFARPRMHWQELLKQLAPDLQKSYTAFSEMNVEELAECTGLSLAEAERALAREFGEPIKWFGPDSLKAQFIDELTAAGATLLQGGRFLHVGDKVNKGIAMDWLKSFYSTEKPDTDYCTIALGDSANDRDMLEAADYAVVIKSPVHNYPKICRTADTYYTKQTGPHGWVEGLTAILKDINLQN